MTVSVAVMAHPKRKRFVDELVPSLGVEPEVVWDRRNDRWDTGRRSLLAFDRSASHHLVVQDDALVSRDLVKALDRAVTGTGEHPVALYIGRSRPYRYQVQQAHTMATKNNAAWLEMPGPWWGVAVIVPTAHIPDLVKWGDRRTDVANYDKRIARWYGHNGIKCWYSMPSLVDHRPVADNPSLIRGRTGNRTAHWFIGTETSAMDVDFSRGTVVAPDASSMTRADRRAMNQEYQRWRQQEARNAREAARKERAATVRKRRNRRDKEIS